MVFEGNLQLSNISRHNGSDDHRKAVEADNMRRSLLLKDDTSTSTTEQDAPKPPRPLKVSDRVLFNTVLYGAKHVLPNDHVNSLLDLQRLNGVECRHRDLHSDTVIDIQKSLVFVLDNLLNVELQECSAFSILCDESTDLSVHKNLIVYVRYVSRDGTLNTKLLGNVKIEDGTAAGITAALLNVLEERGLNVAHMVGFGSDGASVMTGRIRGVGVLLKEHAKHMVQIHCMAHRLALVCVDAVKDNAYMQEYQTKLGQLYTYFSRSAIRCDKLEQIQEVLGDEKVRLKEPIAVRWLAMHNAVIAIQKSWNSLVVFFKTDSSARATELKDFITSYAFVAFTALLCDVLHVITNLSKKLQTESMDISAVNVHINIALASLQGMRDDPSSGLLFGNFLHNLAPPMSTSESDHVHLSFEGIDLSHSSEMDRTSFLELSEMYLDSLIENLEVRLCNNSTRVLDAFCILEPRIAVILSVEERAKYYDILDSHFKVTKDAVEAAYAFVDVPLLKKELVRLTALFSGCYSGLRFDGFARMLLLRHRDDFPQACRLAELGLSLPVSTASCERGFSLQNRIKIKSRTRLLPENLERLMKLAAGPQIESFPVAEAVYHWYRSRRRRLARLYQASRSTATARDIQAIAEYAYENCEEEMVGLDDAYYDVCV